MIKLWCNQQISDETGGVVLCLAHLAECRIFNCPYESNEKRLKSQFPCCDYEAVDNNKE